MNIQQLKEMPAGTRVGGFSLTIKTAKKKWQVDGKWIHQVLVMDNTGEMLADVNIVKNIPLQRAQTFRVIVSEIQAAEQGTKLCVDQFQLDTITEPDNIIDFVAGESDRTIKGKIKTWLVAACLQSGTPPTKIDRIGVDDLVDYVMK